MGQHRHVPVPQTTAARPLQRRSSRRPLLHCTWTPAHGLVWWVELPVRARDVSDPAVHAGASVPAERRLLAHRLGGAATGAAAPVAAALRGPARTARLLLPVRAGVPVPATAPGHPVPQQRPAPTGLSLLRVPVAAPAPAVSVAALDALSGGGGSAVVVGPGTARLAAIVRDLQRWVAAGRVVPDVGPEGAARWVLVDDEDVTAWFEAHVAALPPVLRAAARPGERAGRVAGSTARQVLEAVVPAVLGELVLGRTAPPASPAHPLLVALATGTPVELAPGRLELLRTGLQEWRTSRQQRTARLVLRLQEPDGTGQDIGQDGDDARWPVDVLLSVDGDAPAPLAALAGDREAVDALREGLRHVLALVPALRRADRDASDEGRLWTSTSTVLDLVDHGRDLLRDSGVTLLLPKEWTRREASLELDADGSEDDEESPLGLEHLVSWNWSVALGADRLTEAELEELAAAKVDLVRLRGEWVRVDARSLAAARRFVRGAADGATGRRGNLADLFADLTSAGAPPVPVTRIDARGWLRPLLGGADAAEVAEVPQPSTLQAVLRPYQRRGLSWLAFMDRAGLGAVLADDMGLGKTIQVLSLLLHEREDAGGGIPGPTLLVCPKSLLTTWVREAQRFAPSLQVVVHHGSGRDREDAGFGGADLVVTTYGTLALDAAKLQAAQWHRLVLDEAHHVKNTGTRQARAVRHVHARHRLALTGTPVENRLEELRGVLDAVNPGLLGSAEAFRRQFTRPVEVNRDAAAASRLRTLIRPFVLRRVKTDRAVIADLPDKIEMTVPVTLTREQAALYRASVAALLRDVDELSPMERRGAVLRTLTQLKQICNHPAHFLGDGSGVLRGRNHRSGKLEVVEEVLEEVLAEGDHALLFTQFTEFGNLVAPYLSQRFGVEVPFLHGGTTRRQRDAIVRRFQDDGEVPLLLLSLKAGGTGLTLTRANHVVHLDRWWNPAVENQATDRAFRIGQRRSVQVRKLVTAGTVEERIDTMITQKSELADLVVGAGEGWVTELGTDALRELLTLSDGGTGA